MNRNAIGLSQDNFQEQLNILAASLLALRQQSAEQWTSVLGLSQTLLHELRTLRTEDLVTQAALSTRVDLLAQNLNQLNISMNKLSKTPSFNAETWEPNAETWSDCINMLNHQLMPPLPPTPLSAYSSPGSQSLPPVVSTLPLTSSAAQDLSLFTPTSTYSSLFGQTPISTRLVGGTSNGKEDRETQEESSAWSVHSQPSPIQDNFMLLSMCAKGSGDRFTSSQTEESRSPAAADDSHSSQKEDSTTATADDNLPSSRLLLN